MQLRLRQVALVTRDLAKVEADVAAVLGLAVGHRDPGVARFGLENVIFPIGSQFLEVVAPVKEGTAAGRYLDRRGGDGGYMVITQCDDHAPRRQRVADLGIRIVLEFETAGYRCMQLHPADTGGFFLEIDWQDGWADPDGPWAPAGDHWREAVHTDVVAAIAGVEIQGDEPDKLAARWSDIVEIPVTAGDDGSPALRLENATVRFLPATDGRGEGLGGMDLVATDRDRAVASASERGLPVEGATIVLCGTRLKLV